MTNFEADRIASSCVHCWNLGYNAAVDGRYSNTPRGERGAKDSEEDSDGKGKQD